MYLFVSICLFLLQFSHVYSDKIDQWIVYYDQKAPFEQFDQYQLIVFDSDAYPDFKGFMQQNKTILGYISIGEVEEGRKHFKKVKDMGITLDENVNWPGSYFVDVRDPRWAKLIIEELIPKILMDRFQGIFLDTLDNPIHLEQTDPEKYKGMREAAVNLVKALRRHYPTIKIMMNRAYEILPDLGNVIDYELGECVFSGYDFEKKEYKLVTEEEYQWQVNILKNAALKFSNLQVYTLDYWDPNDQKQIGKIYKMQRENGFLPYVSTIELDKIIRSEEVK